MTLRKPHKHKLKYKGEKTGAKEASLQTSLRKIRFIFVFFTPLQYETEILEAGHRSLLKYATLHRPEGLSYGPLYIIILLCSSASL